MQVSFESNDIAPHLPHMLTFDLKELIPINAKSNNNQLNKKPSESIIEVKAEEVN